jgi:hypothetical protein
MKLKTTQKVAIVETMSELVENDPEGFYATRPKEKYTELKGCRKP